MYLAINAVAAAAGFVIIYGLNFFCFPRKLAATGGGSILDGPRRREAA
jgi:hypothetical protein